MRYDFNEKFSEKDIKIKSEIDFIHELYKLTGVRSYERARIYYIIRNKDNKVNREKLKELKKLKELIINQGKKEILKGKIENFIKKINQIKTEEELKKICEDYNLLPNLELF